MSIREVIFTKHPKPSSTVLDTENPMTNTISTEWNTDQPLQQQDEDTLLLQESEVNVCFDRLSLLHTELDRILEIIQTLQGNKEHIPIEKGVKTMMKEMLSPLYSELIKAEVHIDLIERTCSFAEEHYRIVLNKTKEVLQDTWKLFRELKEIFLEGLPPQTAS